MAMGKRKGEGEGAKADALAALSEWIKREEGKRVGADGLKAACAVEGARGLREETWADHCARCEAASDAAAEGDRPEDPEGEAAWPPIDEPHPFDDEPAAEAADFEDPEGWMAERPSYWLDQPDSFDPRSDPVAEARQTEETKRAGLARLREALAKARTAQLMEQLSDARCEPKAGNPKEPLSPSTVILRSQMDLMRRLAWLELFRGYCERRGRSGRAGGGSPSQGFRAPRSNEEAWRELGDSALFAKARPESDRLSDTRDEPFPTPSGDSANRKTPR